MNSKLKSLPAILKLVKEYKKAGKKIVTTNGAFDLFHYGHAYTLKKSKEKGDVLIVGVNSDKSVKNYKSSGRPIIPQKYRAGLVASLECVDLVFLFDELNPIDFIAKIKPDIHTNSVEYGNNPVEKDTVIKNGGKLVVIKKMPLQSSSAIIKKILKIYGS